MDLINNFLHYLVYTKRYSQLTVEAYRSDLSQFHNFLCETENFPLSEVNQKHIRNWIIYLVEDGVKPRSVNRKITCLKSFYKYLQQQKIVDFNAASGIESMKTEKRLPEYIREEHTEFIFNHMNFGSEYANFRNNCMLELFYLSGIRRAELIALRDLDVNFQNHTIKVTGKRNKQRIIPLNEQFMEKLDQFIHTKHQLFSNDFLFLTDKGEQLYPKLVYRIVNKYLSMVSTQQKKSPHILRHTFATHMLNHGADLNAIKEILGHANLAATEIYTHVSFEKLKSIYKHAHPRAITMED